MSQDLGMGREREREREREECVRGLRLMAFDKHNQYLIQ
jgi:hypothetical protein